MRDVSHEGKSIIVFGASFFRDQIILYIITFTTELSRLSNRRSHRRMMTVRRLFELDVAD